MKSPENWGPISGKLENNLVFPPLCFVGLVSFFLFSFKNITLKLKSPSELVGYPGLP